MTDSTKFLRALIILISGLVGGMIGFIVITLIINPLSIFIIPDNLAINPTPLKLVYYSSPFLLTGLVIGAVITKNKLIIKYCLLGGLLSLPYGILILPPKLVAVIISRPSLDEIYIQLGWIIFGLYLGYLATKITIGKILMYIGFFSLFLSTYLYLSFISPLPMPTPPVYFFGSEYVSIVEYFGIFVQRNAIIGANLLTIFGLLLSRRYYPRIWIKLVLIILLDAIMLGIYLFAVAIR